VAHQSQDCTPTHLPSRLWRAHNVAARHRRLEDKGIAVGAALAAIPVGATVRLSAEPSEVHRFSVASGERL